MVSLFMQVITAFLGLGLGILLFAGDLSYMQAGIAPAAEKAAAVQYGSLKDMVFDIVPRETAKKESNCEYLLVSLTPFCVWES